MFSSFSVSRFVRLLCFAFIFTTCAWQGVCAEIATNVELGSRLIVGFHGTEPCDPEVRQVRDLLRRGMIRGVILFRYNIVSPEQLRVVLKYIKEGRADAIVAVDQEGGTVSRMDEKNGFPMTMASAAQYKSSSEVYRAFNKMGKVMASVGVNLDFAPVLDVNVNPESPAIGNLGRSFSDDHKIVASYGAAAIKGLADAGVMSCGKHFPGHGSATGDTHLGVVDVSETWKRGVELYPFERLAKLPYIMVAHTYNRHLDAEWPASMSPTTYKMLPKYKGKFITDDYYMLAIASRYTEQEFAARALQSGADIVIFGRHPYMMRKSNKEIVPVARFVYDLHASLAGVSFN